MPTTKQHGGAGLSPDTDVSRTQIVTERLGRGFDRGVLTAQPLEDIVVGRDLYLAVLDVGAAPFVLNNVAVQCNDPAGLGFLTVALYRIEQADLFPTRWLARLAASGTTEAMTGATMAEYLVSLSVEKELDRRVAVWMLGCYGSTATMKVRGTDTLTVPALGGRVLSPGGLPAEIASSDAVATAKVPSMVALTQVGLRLRSA